MVVIILECRNCPYGEEDFNRRMYWYEKTVQERGIPNDIYHYLKPEDAPDEFEQFCGVTKLVVKFSGQVDAKMLIRNL